MNTDNTAQTFRSDVSDLSQAIPGSPPPAYHLAVATDDPPPYDGVRLPSYVLHTRDILIARSLSASGMVRLIVTRSETVERSVGPLTRDLELLRRHAEDELEMYSRITDLRRTLDLLRAAARQRLTDAQMLASRVRTYEEHVAALPATSGEVALANQQIAAAKQRLADMYQQAMNADDGVFRIQEFRREYELMKRQLDPSSGTGSFLGRIGRRVGTWLGPLGSDPDLL